MVVAPRLPLAIRRAHALLPRHHRSQARDRSAGTERIPVPVRARGGADSGHPARRGRRDPARERGVHANHRVHEGEPHEFRGVAEARVRERRRACRGAGGGALRARRGQRARRVHREDPVRREAHLELHGRPARPAPRPPPLPGRDGDGHHRAEEGRGGEDASSGERARSAQRRGACEPHQGRVPRHALARAAHAAQRDPRLVADRPARRRRPERRAPGARDDRAQRARPGAADRGPARHEPHHLGQDPARDRAASNLADFVEAAIDTVRPAAEARGVRLEVAIDPVVGR